MRSDLWRFVPEVLESALYLAVMVSETSIERARESKHRVVSVADSRIRCYYIESRARASVRSLIQSVLFDRDGKLFIRRSGEK